MKGKELHNKLKTIEINGEKINFTELAKKLGFNKVQSFYSKLKAKRVDMDFVKEIAVVIGVDMGELITYPILSEPDVPYTPLPKRIAEGGRQLIADIITDENIVLDAELSELVNRIKADLQEIEKAVTARLENK